MSAAAMRSIRCSLGLVMLALVVVPLARGDDPPPPVQLTAQEDHQRIMDLLKITSLRRGADGRNNQAPNAANYDETKANPFPNLPEPLVLKNGKKVTTADRKSTRLNSSHIQKSRMPSSA